VCACRNILTADGGVANCDAGADGDSGVEAEGFVADGVEIGE
jgi:hypothetical protein